jgi:membrane associated rhomboid family serine protease
MFPIGDENAGTTIKPYVNWTIIGLCVVVFLYESILPPGQLDEFFFKYGAIPAQVSQFHDLYTVLTSMFLHGGLLHLGGNMLFLWIFGDNIEDAMGHASYLLFYLLCGFAAAALQIALSPNSNIPLIGASGAIAGVMGAYIVLFPKGKVRTILLLGGFGQILLVPAWVMIGLWFLLQLVSGFSTLGGEDMGGVAFWAHVGGFIAGALLVFLFRDKDAVARQNAVREGYSSWQRMPARARSRGPY